MPVCKARPLDRRRFCLGFLTLALLCVVTSRPAFAGNIRQVLILNGYQSASPGLTTFDNAISHVLQTRIPEQVEVYNEYLDAQRFPEAAQIDRMAAFLHDKFAGHRIDLVIATGSPAVRLLAQHRGTLFPNSQLMFFAAARSRDVNLLRPDVSGITGQFYPAPTVKLALRLQPGTKRIVVVLGNSQPEKESKDLIARDLSVFSDRIKIEYWSGLSTSDLVAKAAKLPPDSLVLYFTVAGSSSAALDIVRKLATAASVPVYSQLADFTGLGVVGGNVSAPDEAGREVGELAVRILTQQVSGIRMSQTSTNIVDWRQLQRWGLNEADLPPGTVVRFRPTSLWEEYKWLVMGGAAVLIVQSILIAALIVQARRRRRSQLVLEQQREELTHLGRVATLGELSGAIAHEINNPLTAILSNAQAGKRFLLRKPADTDEIGAIFDDIVADSKRAGDVIQRLRALFKKTEAHLEPVNLNGIVADVLVLANRKLVEGNVTVGTKLANVPAVRADPIQVKQVLLNLVINACDAMEDNKPGDRGLTIATSYDQRVAQVSVSDRGRGIEASVKERLFLPFVTTKSSGTGLGLSISRSIVVALGGRLWAFNNPDRGATFTFALPVHNA
jgi:signal transduction histidine kinase